MQITVNGPYWVGYDTPESIKKKTEYMNFLDLKGAMVWSVDTDDFKGDYGRKFPILNVSEILDYLYFLLI